MKKFFFLTLIFMISAQLTACGCKHKYLESIDQQPTYENTGVITYTCEICGDSYSEEIPQKEQPVTVSVVSKKNVPIDINGFVISNAVEFEFRIRNHTDKPIRGIEGVLHIYDLFDDEIISRKCNFTGDTIEAQKMAFIHGMGIEINEFIDNELKLYNEDFEDLKFEYELIDVIYDE